MENILTRQNKVCQGPILITLIHVCKKFHKNYCYPSQEKILELMEKWHHCKVSERTLNRWLKYLEQEGYFERKRRIKVDCNGRLLFDSTLYILKKKIFKLANQYAWLLGKGINYLSARGKKKDEIVLCREKEISNEERRRIAHEQRDNFIAFKNSLRSP